jgi:hypothetical protein
MLIHPTTPVSSRKFGSQNTNSVRPEDVHLLGEGTSLGTLLKRCRKAMKKSCEADEGEIGEGWLGR